MRIGDFRVLTFDCYGTLIDWESGIFAALQPLRERSGMAAGRDAVLAAFARAEAAQQALTPAMAYRDLLALVHRRLAQAWGAAPVPAEDGAFGASIGDWPAFADTVPALRTLQQRYALAILSNVDRDSFAATSRHLAVTFDLVVTAEDVGSYKPDPKNFRHMLARLTERGYAASEVLHTAQSLYHDHAPAQALGLATAWIDRRHDQAGFGATMPPPEGTRYDFRFTSLAEMADASGA